MWYISELDIEDMMDTRANQDKGTSYSLSNSNSTILTNHSGEGHYHITNDGAGNTSGLTITGGMLYEDTTATVIYNIVLPTICTFGILGIILTVIVLSRKSMSTSTNCYLMGLAIADLLFLLLFIILLGMSQITSSHQVYYYMSSIYPTIAPIFMNMFLLASIWLTVMLAVERDIAISRPFVANKICTVKNARIIIILIFIFAFLCRLPNFWESKLVKIYNPHTNSNVVYMDATDLAYNKHYNLIYSWVVDGVLASILPFILLLVLNAHLIWVVHKSTKYMQGNLPDKAVNYIQKEELQITIMLITVITVFFICQAPYVIYTVIASINAFQTSVSILRFRYIAIMLLTFKSSVNFVLYCWFSDKFWVTLKRLFGSQYCCEVMSHKQNGNSSYSNLRRSSNMTRDTII